MYESRIHSILMKSFDASLNTQHRVELFQHMQKKIGAHVFPLVEEKYFIICDFYLDIICVHNMYHCKVHNTYIMIIIIIRKCYLNELEFESGYHASWAKIYAHDGKISKVF